MKTLRHPASLTIIYWVVTILMALLIAGTAHFAVKTTQNMLLYLEFKSKGDLGAELQNYGFVWTLCTITGIIRITLYFFLVVFFKRFIRNIRAGITFYDDNLRNLKKLACVLLLLGLFQTAEYFVVAKHNLEMDRSVITLQYIYSIGWKFAIAGFIWVLAHIFTIGMILQKEKDLTI